MSSERHGWSKYWHDHAQVLIERPIRIVLIILVALALRWFLHRLIDRLIRPVRNGDVPRLLRPLRQRAGTNTLLEASGLLSERRSQRAGTVASVLKSFTSVTIFVLAFLSILSELQLDLAPFIAGTSIIGVALGFGAQNVVKDFLSGMFMIFEDQYGVGDIIDFEKASGTVEAIGLRTTKLRDVQGTVWYVRNGEVVRVGNKSQGFAQVVLDIPIAATTDLEIASAAMLDVAERMHAEEEWADAFLSAPEVQGVEAYTRLETVIRLVARVRPMEQWRVARELRRRIRERFDAMHITAVVEPEEDEDTEA